jgi:hypothetical protein
LLSLNVALCEQRIGTLRGHERSITAS